MTKEIHTGTMEIDKPGTIIMPALGEELLHGEGIPAIDTSMAAKNYIDELAFMEEMMEIRIEPSAEDNPRQILDFYVNGVPVWIRVGEPTWVKRKYVEVIARSKPMSIRTEHDTPETSPESGPQNRVLRSSRAQFPFSVLTDKNPRGHAWLTRILAER